jgi:NNP family nitrate/nitrite transporter-like MFS transporter
MSQLTRTRWWVLANVVLVNVVVTGIAWNYVIMFVPEVTADLGLELTTWGALWSAIPLGVLLFSLPAGALGDRFGVRIALSAGLVVAAASLALRANAGGVVTMFCSMAGFGVGLGLLLASFPKAIAQVFPPSELGMANGFAQAGIGVGLGSATLLAPWLAEPLGGWRGLSLGLAGASLAMAGVWFASFRDSGASEPAAAGSGPAASLGEVLRVRQVRLVALCYALYMGGYLGAIGYLPTYLTTTRGLAPEAAGALMSLGPWAFTLGSMLLPTLSDRIGRRRVVYLPGMLIGGLALFAASLTTGATFGFAIAALGLATGVVGLLFVIPVESEGVGEARAASAVGVITAAGFLGGFLSPIVGMTFVGLDATLGFGFWALCFVASALLILLVKETGSAGRSSG